MTCWEILEIADTSTVEEVKQAYRRLSIEHHPDHGGDSSAFHRVHLAYVQATEIAQRPVLCSKCGGLGRVQLRTSFTHVTCDQCLGKGGHPRK